MCSPMPIALIRFTPVAAPAEMRVTHLEPAAALRADAGACWSLPHAAGMADQEVVSSFEIEGMEEEPERWDGLS